MLDKLDNIDWGNVEAPEVRRLLKTAASKEHQEARLGAISALRDYLVPWELVDGYAYQELWVHLDKLMENDIPAKAIPFLIEILRASTTFQDKSALFEILYDLCRYATMPGLGSSENADRIRVWAKHTQQCVRTGIDLYRIFLLDEEPDIRVAAIDVLRILGDDSYIAA